MGSASGCADGTSPMLLSLRVGWVPIEDQIYVGFCLFVEDVITDSGIERGQKSLQIMACEVDIATWTF